MRHSYKDLPTGYRLNTIVGEGWILEGHTLARLSPDPRGVGDDAIVLPNNPKDLRTIADVLYAVAAYLDDEPVGTKLPLGPSK